MMKSAIVGKRGRDRTAAVYQLSQVDQFVLGHSADLNERVSFDGGPSSGLCLSQLFIDHGANQSQTHWIPRETPYPIKLHTTDR